MHPPDPEYRLLTRALKRLLKVRGLTYRDLGRRLALSEASIKRIFGRTDGPIGKLIRICNVLEIDFLSLVMHAHKDHARINYLTEAQELFFAANLPYFDVFVELTMRKRSIAELQALHGLKAASIRKYLKKLEALGLLEVHPHDRIRVRLHEPVGFAKDGVFRVAFTQRFVRQIAKRLGDSKHREFLLTREWMLSPSTRSDFTLALQSLCTEFDQRAAREQNVHSCHDLLPVALLVGLTEEALKFPIPNI